MGKLGKAPCRVALLMSHAQDYATDLFSARTDMCLHLICRKMTPQQRGNDRPMRQRVREPGQEGTGAGRLSGPSPGPLCEDAGGVAAHCAG